MFSVTEGCFSKGWKGEYVVLHKDSMLVWYKDRDDHKAVGRVWLKVKPSVFGQHACL